jgi:hypothetical protein
MIYVANVFSIIFIVFLIVLIIFYLLKQYFEIHKKDKNFKSNNFVKTKQGLNFDFVDDKFPIIWLYWENAPGKIKPSYISLCHQTIFKHCKNVIILDQYNLENYFPGIRSDINILSIPQKADYIRLKALHDYGGMWLDSDIIVFKSLEPLLIKLQTNDFVGFGCHNSMCSLTGDGYGKPANWAFLSRKNGKLITHCLNTANIILDTHLQKLRLKQNYHKLGRELLWSEIQKLQTTDKSWKYYHVNSNCIERDSRNIKFTNERFLSEEDIDPKCTFYMTPMYNTAPGFPKWFVESDIPGILNKNMLVSKLFRKALL